MATFPAAYLQRCHEAGLPPHALILHQSNANALEIANIKLSEPALEATWAAAEQSAETLIKINIESVQLKGTSLLGNALRYAINLQELRIVGCVLDVPRSESILSSLAASNTPLNKLTLRDCGLQSSFACTLASCIECGNLSMLSELDLSGNNIRDAGATKLARAVENSAHERLDLVTLQRTGVGARTASAWRTLASHCGVRVDLKYNKVGHRVVNELLAAMLIHRGKRQLIPSPLQTLKGHDVLDNDSSSGSGGGKSSSSSSNSSCDESDDFESKIDATNTNKNEHSEALVQTPVAGAQTLRPTHEIIDECLEELKQTPTHTSVNVDTLQTLTWCADAVRIECKQHVMTQHTNRALTGRLRQLAHDLDVTQNQLVEEKNQVRALEADVSRCESTIDKKQTRCLQLTDTVSILKDKVKSLTAQVESVQSRLKARSNHTEQASKHKAATAHQHTWQVQQAEAHNQQLMRQLSRANGRVAELEQRLKAKVSKAQMRAMQSRKRNQTLELQTALDAEKSKAKRRDERLGKLQSQLTQMFLLTKKLEEEASTAKMIQSTAETAKIEAEEQIEAMKTRCDSLGDVLNEQQNRVHVMEEAKDRADSQVESLQQELSHLASDNARLARKSSIVAGEVTAAKQNERLSEKTVKELQSKLGDLMVEHEAVEEKLTDANLAKRAWLAVADACGVNPPIALGGPGSSSSTAKTVLARVLELQEQHSHMSSELAKVSNKVQRAEVEKEELLHMLVEKELIPISGIGVGAVGVDTSSSSSLLKASHLPPSYPRRNTKVKIKQ